MRKKILAGAIALTLSTAFVGCGSSSDSSDSVQENASLEQTEFNVGYLNSTAHLLAFVAKEEGYFADEGLDVTLTQFSSASELVTGLESSKLDTAFIGSVPTITFQSQGHDVTIFGGAMSNGHGYVIKPEFTEGVENIDINILKGRNVASVKNSVQDAELLILLRDAGLEIGEGEDQVNVVYFDSQKDAYAALQGQEIDAASVYSPYSSLAQAAGYEVIYYCNEVEQFENQPCCRQVASTSALSEKPNTYNAFERALIKAYKFSQDNHEGTIKDVQQYIDIEPEYIEYEVYGGHADSNPDPDKQATAALKDEIVNFGYTTDYDIDNYYNTDIYSKALESLISENPDEEVYKTLQEHFNTYE
ncbi:MAG: ABC transporter substrate-binding protein [Porcipelethomonas sp.]